MSIRARFIIAVVGTLAVALALFAALSIVTVHRTLESALDSNLTTTAEAIAAAIDVHDGVPNPDAGDLQQIATLRATARAAIIDAHGRVVAGDQLPPNLQSQKDMHIAVARIARHDKYAGRVEAWRSDVWVDELDRLAIFISLAVGFVVLAIGALVAYRVADTIVAPIDRVASLMERIEGRDLSLRIGPMGIVELARLSAAFDRMLQRLEAAFTRERQFTADASHELRAPLAVVRAEAELALRRERTSEEYQRAFQGVLREVERLEVLVDDLLAAARAEVDAADRRTVDIALLTQDVVDRCKPAAEVKHVKIVADDRHSELVIDPFGVERALLAIVHNAIAFAPPEGTVNISVEPNGTQTAVVVRDNGKGFSREALDNATQRFWRGDGARSRGGTGLGLAIARALVEANGGELHLENDSSGGAKVSLVFPHPSA